MRTNLFFLILPALLALFSGCSKEQCTENKIVGKWKLVSRYDGYLNGGNFQWNQVPDEHVEYMVFGADGSFNQYDAANNCTGNYLVAPVGMVEVVSTCQMFPYTLNISKLTHNTLIIDFQGREGTVRRKFKRK